MSLSVRVATVAACGLMIARFSAPGPAVALEMEGFTEPYRTIDVAADETGTVEEVFVRDGETVEAGQPLARLNSEVHQALLAIAEQSSLAEGRLDAARANWQMKRDRLQKLQPLRLEGHARQEEVDRASAEVAVAEANVRTAQEDLATRRLEYEKIRTQIARRTVRAPVAGVVTTRHKEVGEFVAPNNPDLLTLVQVDRLLANFTLMGTQAELLQLDQEIEIDFPSGLQTTGVVEFISPVIDAESGTLLVKLCIDNSAGRFRSGQRCKIRIGD